MNYLILKKDVKVVMGINDKKDWCKFFKNIEKDPYKTVKGLTVRDFFEAKKHSQSCKSCFDSIDRVLAKAPPKKNKPNLN